MTAQEPRWLDDDEQRAWRAYLRMQGRLEARLNRQLQADSGLSLADYSVLVELTDTDQGGLRPFDLQRRLDWEQSRLSHHLTRMQKRGLIDRDQCGEDGRGALVVVTRTGRRALEVAAPAHVEAVRQWFFDGLTPAQVRLVGDLAAGVLGRLS
jgi:DNA-binding MarR family transcriptional regulator